MSDRDRDELIELVFDASNRNPFPEAEDIADVLYVIDLLGLQIEGEDPS